MQPGLPIPAHRYRVLALKAGLVITLGAARPTHTPAKIVDGVLKPGNLAIPARAVRFERLAHLPKFARQLVLVAVKIAWHVTLSKLRGS